jgi:hypothetical protein
MLITICPLFIAKSRDLLLDFLPQPQSLDMLRFNLLPGVFIEILAFYDRP